MTKQEEALELLQALRGANISYKAFAQITGINLNSLYTWTQKKKFPEKKAEYIINSAKYYFPEEYEIITINKRIREALLRGDDDFSSVPLDVSQNSPPQENSK